MNEAPLDLLLTNATLATMADEQGYGLRHDAAIGISGDRIAWIGVAGDAPVTSDVQDCAGKLITPCLIDCHTHLVYGGHRANEFEMRLNGESYEAIAKAGGGIIATVQATREASQDELVESALKRLDHLIAEGVGTVEIKSGYGLNIETELTMLRAARQLEKERVIRVKTTLLAAHAIPPEFKDRPDDYIDMVCLELLPQAHGEGLVDAVDGFCETIGFTPAQIERVFIAAEALGLPVKLHAEQLSDSKGAVLAAKYSALSADHLECLAPEDTATLAKSETVAVLLPGAFYTLRETKLPPINALRQAGVAMAVATDCNPGTSPLTSLLLAMNMGCTLFGLTPQEALAGSTRNAAKALGIGDLVGTIEVGKQADLAIWDSSQPAELVYRLGYNPLMTRMIGGRV